MFLYQNRKLYVEDKGIYVGVSFTPTSFDKIPTESTKFKDGLLLTTMEVRAKLGSEYHFPIKEKVTTEIKEVEKSDDSGKTKRTKKSSSAKK